MEIVKTVTVKFTDDHFAGPVKQWFDLIGEKTIADATTASFMIHRIELKGESLRKEKHKQ